MVNSSKLEIVERFFSGTGSSYDWIVKSCTLGFDLWWKEKLLWKIPRHPKQIIEQAAGTGILTFKIARRFPGTRVIGVELRDEYLSVARRKAERQGLQHVELILGRAEGVVLEGEFDCILSSYLAKYAELEPLVRNAGRMLRPGGRLIMHDFIYPPNPQFAVMWKTYLQILRALGSRAYGEWRVVFDELPGFLRETRWVFELVEVLRQHDFQQINLELLTFGSSAIVSAQNR
jgi:demethylmenaquinone methyltransferase / 2-methoxy-6-polyprenyl-1,4-benzoquinol methylase